MLTTEDRTYLENKHRGGINNTKGNSYEAFYAVYKIALLLRLYPKNYEDIILSSQIQYAFVDDLLINHYYGKLDYYQLKNNQDLTWQSGSTHTLEYDFKRQKEEMEENSKIFSLFLVYSDENSNVTSIPESISDCTQTEYFPYFSDLNRLLMESSVFKNAIFQISAYPFPQIDKLFSLASMLLGVWESLDKENVPLSKIVQKIKDYPLSGNNFIFDESFEIDKEAMAIFNKISDFTYMNIGAAFYWKYKEKDNGEINKASYLSFEREVLKHQPTNFDELESLM
jgi:hypothetical protein